MERKARDEKTEKKSQGKRRLWVGWERIKKERRKMIGKEKRAKEIRKEYIKKGFDSMFRNKSPENCELVDLHQIYKNLLYIEDTKRIDIVLATALSRKLDGIPIWLILVGSSGDMKSVQLNALRNLDGIYYLHKITSKTLVNGHLDKKKHPDLAPRLKDKIVVIRDMASLLKLPPVEKGEVWGQLRDLYDGFAGTASGQGLDIKYEDLKVTLLAASTHAIDGQILVHQDLGTRELIYRTKGSNNKKKVMEKCLDNEETEAAITEELARWTCGFLNNLEPKRDTILPGILDTIKQIALYITYMRATAELDQYTNEVRTDVYPEEPTRVVKQLKRLYICLLSLAKDYPEWRALDILWDVARSSAFPMRVKLLDFLIKNKDGEFTTSQISREIHIGKSTSKRELSVLWNMKIVNKRDESTNYPDKFIEYWKLDLNHKFIKSLSSRPYK